VTTLDTPLTARQRYILGVIYRLTLRYGRPPTFREMMVETGIKSPNGILGHIYALARAGWLPFPDAGHFTARSLLLRGLRYTLTQDDAGRRLAAALEDTPDLTPPAKEVCRAD
jgi:SOS-response transcriptional repressor LexA